MHLFRDIRPFPVLSQGFVDGLNEFPPLSLLHVSKICCLMFSCPAEEGFGEAVFREGILADLLCEDVNNGPCCLLTGYLFNVPTEIGLRHINKRVPKEVLDLWVLDGSLVRVCGSEDAFVAQCVDQRIDFGSSFTSRVGIQQGCHLEIVRVKNGGEVDHLASTACWD